MNRRTFLAAGSLAALAPRAAADAPARTRLGVVAYSFAIRRAAEPGGPLHDPLGFLEHCRARGAGGVQLSLGVRDAAYCARLRERVGGAGMYLEGIVRL